MSSIWQYAIRSNILEIREQIRLGGVQNVRRRLAESVQMYLRELYMRVLTVHLLPMSKATANPRVGLQR